LLGRVAVKIGTGRNSDRDGSQFQLPRYALSEVHEVARVERKPVLEESLAAEILHVGIAHPFFGQCLIAQISEMFQQQAAHHQADRLGWLTCL